MNNEPVAYVDQIWMDRPDLVMSHQLEIGKLFARTKFTNYIPLYTHPIKELTKIVVASATCSCGKVMEVTNLQLVKDLTDEEINDAWTKSQEDGIAVQQGFTTQQHYFAHLILRKAQEK